MKKATLRATASAFALLGAGFTGAAMIAAPAAAQDYTSAALSGTVTDEGGAVISGATVQLVSLDLGFTRTSTTGANGSFRYAAVPAGNYDLVVSRDGAEVYRAEGIRLLASQNADVDVVVPGGGATSDGEAIVIQGSQLINDFEGTTTGLNVDLEELVKTVPISRDLTSVVLLAPGTTAGDSSFGNLASIGGSSVAENAYYLNGLNITNFDNYLGSARVPFEMYRSVEVKSGGYPAEFGRATGGIVNAVTKAGSNDWSGAVHINWAPNFLRSEGKDLFSNTSGQTTNNADDEADSLDAILELGGPVIRDRLFVYGLLELRDNETLTTFPVSGSANLDQSNDPFWGAKIDAYPIDNHHLEFTMFDTRRQTDRTVYAYNMDTGVGGETGGATFNFGGFNYVGKYTGNFTDWLTLSAAYGKMRDRFDNVGSNPAPYVVNASGVTVNGIPNGGFATSQRTQSVSLPYNTEREFYRGDADVYVSLMGDHHFRFGFDVEENTLNKATVRNSGDYLLANGYISNEAYSAGAGGAGFLYIYRPNDVVELNYFNSGGAFTSTNKAFYLQDEWNVTDRLTLNLGVRRDDFRLNRADGDPLADLKENYAPRLGFTYDLWPEQNGKFYGFYGQYYLPIASNTAFRTVGSEFYTRQRYTYTGFRNDGTPILGPIATTEVNYNGSCPFPLIPGGGTSFCNTTGDGIVPPSTAIIAANLKATKETEWILGYEHDFGGFTAGINYINRRLNTTAEDAAIDAAVLAYCDREGIAGCSSTWTGFHQYTIYNPGSDLVVNLDGLDGRQVTLTAEELGYPKAVRKYDAVELTFNRPWDGRWSLGGSYTWSKSRGNSEGYVQSDFGQADAGITQDFDQPGFADGAYGRLPNDRRHRIKLFGAYGVTDALVFGTNIRIDSERPLSCFGYHPTDPFANAYGAASHYCGLQLSPRGTASKSDWIYQVDLSGRYNIDMGSDRLLTLRADVFNVFNSQGATTRNEIGEIGFNVPNPNYDLVTGYQAARSVRLGADISF